MYIKNINDMKYAMRIAQRDVFRPAREPFYYTEDENAKAVKFYIGFWLDHGIDDESYIGNWSFGKTITMSGKDTIVSLVENSEQSFDDVAAIALKALDKISSEQKAFDLAIYDIIIRDASIVDNKLVLTIDTENTVNTVAIPMEDFMGEKEEGLTYD